MNDRLVMQVKGNNGRLLIFEDYVFFERKSFLGSMESLFSANKNNNVGEKKVEMSKIQGVEWGMASIWKNGYISLSVIGESKNMNGLFGAGKHPTSIVFFPVSNMDAERCVNYLNRRIRETKSYNVGSQKQLSAADEIRKYKALLDDGIITEEEFELKKKQLLGF